MDEPWRSLGKRHRQMRHDPYKTPFEAFLMSGGDWNAYASAYCHIMLDRCQINPKIIEILYVALKNFKLSPHFSRC